MKIKVLWLASLAFILALLPAGTSAQSLYYLNSGGHPAFNTPEPVELGFIDMANGDLHLEIPLASPVQRGALTTSVRLVYDGRIWEVFNNGTSESWQPTNLFNFTTGGWNWVISDNAQVAGVYESLKYCNGSNYTTYYGPWVTLGEDGTTKFFPAQTQQDFGCGNQNIATATAFDQESTGSSVSVSNYTTDSIRDHTGTSLTGLEDMNGNKFTINSSGFLVDTLDRVPMSASSSGSVSTLTVPNAQGTNSSYTLNFENINVSTNFGVSGVSEYSGTIEVVSSIGFPDGTSYSFSYDSGTTPGHYGELTGITLRTGGQVTYTWNNFKDAYGNVNQWVASRASGGGTWSFTPAVVSTCTSSQVGCQQTVTEAKPSGDQTVYTFTLNNGAWNTETQYYSGSSTLLKQVTTAYDFSNACPDCGGVGAAYIRPTQVNAYMPGAGTTQTEYSYDSIYYGNVASIKQWNYYSSGPGATPNRETDYTYLNSSPYITANILNRVTDQVTYQNSAKEAETQTSYDSTGLTSVTGIFQHDDTNYGASNTVRGNPTSISKWVSGSSYLTTTNYYDTTGQLVKTTDPKGNSVTYGYTDAFYNGSPSSPTNAYRTSETLPVSGTKTFGYFYGTGQLARATDQNGQATYLYFGDPLDRPAQVSYAGGAWTVTAYPSATETDQYKEIQYATPSDSCSTCVHTQTMTDGLGRVTEQILASDPAGATTISTTYDSSGRVATKSNPYRSTSDPTYGLETYTYDGLNRATSDTHADNNAVHTYYGAAVTSAGGIGTQLCSSGTYGLGFPALTIDEAGHKSENWTDVFGNVIEADEPDTNGNLTISTCYTHDALNDLTEVVQGGQTRTYVYDGLGRETSETTPEAGTVTYSFTGSGGLCAGNPRKPCSRTDARGIITTYAYDAESRLLSKTYSDSTPAAYYYYDESSVKVGSDTYTVNNGKGRLTHTSADGGNALTVHNYDASGRTLDIYQCTPFNCSTGSLWDMKYYYFWGGFLSGYKHPVGYTISIEDGYDGRPNQIYYQPSGGGAETLALIGYAPQGAVASFQNGGTNQTKETYDYNNRLQLVRSQLAVSGGSGDIACAVYNYYPGVANPTSCAIPTQGSGDDGNVAGHYDQDNVNTSLSHTAAFTYDAEHRLTAAAATGNSTYNLAYVYDRYGNMTCSQNQQTQGLCPQYGFSASTNQINNSGFSYDASGNMLSDNSHTYKYDAEGRLISVDNGTTASYVYNAEGERVEKDAGGSYTEYVFGLTQKPEGEYNRTTWTDTWVSFEGRHFAHFSNGDTYFVHADRIGTTNIVTDWNTGTVIQDELHYPWGQVWTTAGSSIEERYASLQHRDSESNLDPTKYRMFSSDAGRWTTPDPADQLSASPTDPQSWNRYAYALDDSVGQIDPYGLDSCAAVNIWNGSYEGSGDPFNGMCSDTYFGPTAVTITDGSSLSPDLSEGEAEYGSQVGLTGCSYSGFGGCSSQTQIGTETVTAGGYTSQRPIYSNTGSTNIPGFNASEALNDAEELAAIDDVIAPFEVRLVPAIFGIYSGLGVAVASGAAMYIFPPSVPVALPVALGGLGIAAESAYYGFTGRMYVPSWLH